MKVVLPAPFGPSKPKVSPRSMRASIPASAWTSALPRERAEGAGHSTGEDGGSVRVSSEGHAREEALSALSIVRGRCAIVGTLPDST